MACNFRVIVLNYGSKLLVLTGCFVLACGCQEKPAPTQKASAKMKTERSSLASKPSTLVNRDNPAVFDIPPLLQLSVSQAKAKLGPPIDEVQADYENATRMLIYKKQGLVLSVSYLVDTRQVDMVSLSIERDTTATQYLLPLGNLSANDNAYLVDTLHSEKAGFYRGIVVRRNPPVEYPTAP